MKSTIKTISLLTVFYLCVSSWSEMFAADKPNIILIYADDMGYGDVQCLNPDRGKIPTPTWTASV